MPETPNNSTALARFEQRYGAYAFGVMALLVLWWGVMAPMQKEQSAQATAVERTAAHVADTADSLERMTTRLSGRSNP